MNRIVAYMPRRNGFLAGIRPFVTNGVAENRPIVTNDPRNAVSYASELELWHAVSCVSRMTGISIPQEDIVFMSYEEEDPVLGKEPGDA